MDLPQEVALNVLQNLLRSDATNLLQNLQKCKDDANAQAVMQLLYFRLYSGYLEITYGDDANEYCDFSASPGEFFAKSTDSVFLGTVPRTLDMIFVREVRDYTKFQNQLGIFTEVLDSPWAAAYFARIPQISFMLDGRSNSIESPTLTLAQILNTLIKLTTLGKANLAIIDISTTNIGDHFPSKWGMVFGDFAFVTVLVLRGNSIELELYTSMGRIRVLEECFRWPPQLKWLSLAGNMIRQFTVEVVRQLPKSLEVLNISDNILGCIGAPVHSPFSLLPHLPKLTKFDLSGNLHLSQIDRGIFEGGSKVPGQLCVIVYGCGLLDLELERLKTAAKMEKVMLVI